MTFRTVAVFAGLLVSGPSFAQEDVAAQASEVLKTYCARCHDRKKTDNGGFDYLLDRDALVARKKVVPGQAGDSELLQRAIKGEMPPAKSASRPRKEDLAILEQWIAAGAPKWDRPVVGLSETAAYRLIAADLQALPERERRFIRYFTLGHLAAAGWSAEEIEACRRGLAKLLNSLSWHPRLTPPRQIDARGLAYRIDLRDYKWSERLWDRLAAQYPYAADAVSRPPKTLRADWFIATASGAAFYYELLQVPAADRALERLLQVDAPANIDDGSARRAGFTDSGVSKNNRLIERHDAGFGAYWRSYDFSASTERQNLFDHPLGPPPARNSFVHAGGEMIFHLPNGLLGFLVTDGAGKRIERAPVEIVSDPQRPEKIVEAGISCFHCHAKGFIPKADMVRAHVIKNAQAFAKEDVEVVQALYRPDTELRKLLDRDNERYHAALRQLGIRPDDADPINHIRNRYEGLVDLKTAAAELALEPAQLAARLRQSETLQRSLGALLAEGGTVQRPTFLNALRELSEPTAKAEPAQQPFSGHTGRVHALAFTIDSKRAASGSADRTARLWEVASGKELRRLEHPRDVLAVAISADGRRLLTGGEDRLLRLWDLETGKVLRELAGHTDYVRTVALAADGRRAASSGDDKSVRLWDLELGKEIAAIRTAEASSGLAFAPDGRQLAGASDYAVQLWDASTGKAVRRLAGHTGSVNAVAFSPDGQRIVSGSGDKSVRVWDAVSGRELLVLKGHGIPVISVAFSADGRRILSGTNRYAPDDNLRVWDAASGRELRRQASDNSVRGVAFAPDGLTVLTSGGGDPPIRLWKLPD